MKITPALAQLLLQVFAEDGSLDEALERCAEDERGFQLHTRTHRGYSIFAVHIFEIRSVSVPRLLRGMNGRPIVRADSGPVRRRLVGSNGTAVEEWHCLTVTLFESF